MKTNVFNYTNQFRKNEIEYFSEKMSFKLKNIKPNTKKKVEKKRTCKYFNKILLRYFYVNAIWCPCEVKSPYANCYPVVIYSL